MAGVVASIVVTAMPQAAFKAENTATTEDFKSFTPGFAEPTDGWQFAGPPRVAIDDPNIFGVSDHGGSRAPVSRTPPRATRSTTGRGLSHSPTTRASQTADGGTLSQVEFVSRTSRRVSTSPRRSWDEQPGLQFSLAPDRGDGARMSFLRFNDTSGGIDVTFSNYIDKHPQGGAETGPDATGPGCVHYNNHHN